MLKRLLLDEQTSEFAASTNYTSLSLERSKGFAMQVEVTVTTPSAKTFTADAGTDVCTSAAHSFKTGLKVQVSTAGALPAGLSAATDYFVIVVAATTFKLATSLANAQAGTAINITDAGTGTHTVTPTAIAGASVKLQGSVDGTTYVDIASTSNNITATANFLYSVVDPMYQYVRAAYTMTAGQISVTQRTLVKGE